MRKVFLDELPRWKKGEGAVKVGTINWNKCIGIKVPFIYGDLLGEIEIVDYINEGSRVIISYKGKQMNIFSGSLREGNIGKLFNKITKDFKIGIGEIFKDDKRDLVINDREYRQKEFTDKEGYDCVHNHKWYKYTCNKCGWTEGWSIEYDLLKGNGCSCCNGKTVVPEINSIYAKAPWMIDLGVSEEDARKYTPQCHTKIEIACPDCGKKKKMATCNIYRYKTIKCPCGDGFSYPEKFMYSLLKQLNLEFIMQLSKTTFDWCDKYKYDFYIPEYNMIIETHGEQHYKDCSWSKASEVEENDKLKERLAKDNGVKSYVVIDCRESTLNWIKDNILNSKLNKLLDLSKVNWKQCGEYALKNIAKEVCDRWNNRKEEEAVADMQIIFGLSRHTVLKYLKTGNDNKWCYYDSDNARREGYEKAAKHNKNKFSKKVQVFKDEQYSGTFISVAELVRQSEELFGVKFIGSQISSVCNGKRKHHKGFTFKYVENNE